ncbi:MAG TPA: hypothetical protein VH813_09225 [Candidatus Limnocylindrales bacterium]|jgi:hypothetical protein
MSPLALLVIAVIVFLAARWISRRVSVSFGQGFLSPPGREDWPHGVQEDDDFHWTWDEGRRDPVDGAVRRGRGAVR